MSAPAVAVAANGTKFAAAWKDKRTGEANVFWTMADELRFSDDSLVHDAVEGDQNHPSLAIDPAGTLWAAWEDSRSGTRQIWTRSSLDADGGRAISDEREGNASFPVIAAAGETVVVVYEAKKDERDSVIVRRLRP